MRWGLSSLQKISDHFPIFFSSAKPKPIVPHQFITVRDFLVKNVNNFKNDLSALSWNNAAVRMYLILPSPFLPL